jgi:O-antigen ligase
MASKISKRSVDPGLAFTLLIVSLSFTYLRWQDVFTFLAPLKLPGLLGYGFVIWWFIKGEKAVLFREPLILNVIALISLMAVSVFYSANISSIFITRAVFLTVFSYSLPLIFLAKNWTTTLSFFKAWVVIHLLIALFALKNGGVGNGDFLADENDLALGVAMGMPFAYFLGKSEKFSKNWKLIFRIAFFLLGAAVIATRSRGGFLGLSSVVFIIWWFSQKRIRNLLIGVVVVVFLGTVIIQLAPAGYVDRMNTMSDPKNATRVERLRSWEIGYIMWKHNPIFGVGAGQYKWNTVAYERMTSYWVSDNLTKTLAGREAHSLYFSLLADLGIVGAALYALLVWGILRTLTKIIRAGMSGPKLKRDSKKNDTSEIINVEYQPEGVLLAKALIGSTLAFLVSGAFISVVYYPHLWLIAGFVVVLKNNFYEQPDNNKKTKNPV